MRGQLPNLIRGAQLCRELEGSTDENDARPHLRAGRRRREQLRIRSGGLCCAAFHGLTVSLI